MNTKVMTNEKIEHLECKKNCTKMKERSYSENKKKEMKNTRQFKTVKNYIQDSQFSSDQPEDKEEDEYEIMTEYGEETVTDSVKQWLEVVTEDEGLKYTIKEWKNDLNGCQNQKTIEIIYAENKGVGELQKVKLLKPKTIYSAKVRTRDLIYKEFIKDDLYLTQKKMTRVYNEEPLADNKKNIKEIYWWISSKGDKKLEGHFCNHRKDKVNVNDTIQIESSGCFASSELLSKLRGNYRKIEYDQVNDKICPEKCEKHEKQNELDSEEVKHKMCRKMTNGPKPVNEEIKNVERIKNVLCNVNFRKPKLTINKCEYCGKFKKPKQSKANDLRHHFNFSNIDIIRKQINEAFIKKKKTNSHKHKKKQIKNKVLFTSKKYKEWLEKLNEKKKIQTNKKVKLPVLHDELREKIMKLSYGITPLSIQKKEQKEWDLLIQKSLKSTPAWKYLCGKLEEICHPGRSKVPITEMKKQANLWDEREIMEQFWKKKMNSCIKSNT